MGMFFSKCSNCGTKVKTWQSYVDIVLWSIGIVWLLYAQINGYYERDNITLQSCGDDISIIGINDFVPVNPISVKEAIDENGGLDTKKVSEIADREKQEYTTKVER